MGNTAGTIRRPSELRLDGRDWNGAGGCSPGNQTETDSDDDWEEDKSV